LLPVEPRTDIARKSVASIFAYAKRRCIVPCDHRRTQYKIGIARRAFAAADRRLASARVSISLVCREPEVRNGRSTAGKALISDDVPEVAWIWFGNVRELTMKSSVLCALIGAMALTLFAMPANAQATRTWVSGVGDDANPCSRTAPCKTFAGAISKTAAAGEIDVLDPGGFGALTITKSITIRSDHFEAGVLVSGTNGIVVAAGVNDTVVLEGLDFDGIGSGLNGVSITSGKVVYIIRCAIRRFTQNGVNMVSSIANSQVFIKDSLINSI